MSMSVMHIEPRTMDIDAKRAKKRRLALGLTQLQVADRSGLSQESISRIEGGRLKGRQADTQEKLAGALGVSVDWLLGRGSEADVGTPPQVTDGPPAPARPERVEPVDESPLEAALGEAFDKTKHALRDVVAVQKALRSFHQKQKDESDLVVAARAWLDAAAALRKEGTEVTLEALLWRVTVGKPSAHNERVANERTTALNDEARARAKAAGYLDDEDESK
jgi:transcriptional regulator with XRE-family HTH domain